MGEIDGAFDLGPCPANGSQRKAKGEMVARSGFGHGLGPTME
jgi:hypothetical protein